MNIRYECDSIDLITQAKNVGTSLASIMIHAAICLRTSASIKAYSKSGVKGCRQVYYVQGSVQSSSPDVEVSYPDCYSIFDFQFIASSVFISVW